MYFHIIKKSFYLFRGSMAENNFQLRVRKRGSPESNFQLRVRKDFLDRLRSSAISPPQIRSSAEDNFQLRVRRGPSNAERNFQLRVRRSDPSTLRDNLLGKEYKMILRLHLRNCHTSDCYRQKVFFFLIFH